MHSGPISKGHVLIVDDSRTMREILSRQIAGLGFWTAAASDGVDALAFLAQASEPWIILLDVWMPRMGGGEVVATLARVGLTKYHRIVVMTGTQLDEDPWQQYVNAIVYKPFTVQDITPLLMALSQSITDQAAHISAAVATPAAPPAVG